MIQTKTQVTSPRSTLVRRLTRNTQLTSLSQTNLQSAVHAATPHIVSSHRTPTVRVTARRYQQAQTHSISGPHPSTISLAIVPPTSLSTLSDHQLLMLCTQYGTQAKAWRQKFSGLLPEVDRRQLYLKEGCSSIFEFAAKLGGVSKEQVLVVLRLHQRFDSTPVLQHALVSGDISVNKLARVVSVATPENQEFWTQQSKQLSQAGLETLVRDSKSLRAQTQNPNKTEKIPQSDELKLSPNMRERLLALQNKGLNLEELLEEFLIQREESIQRQKQQIAEEMKKDKKSSRYIPAKIKHLLKQAYGEKCAQDQCTNKAATIHHTRRFSLTPDHNPLFLAPLCKQHHEIAHSIDVRVQEHKR